MNVIKMNVGDCDFTPSELTSHFKEEDIISYTVKLERLNISDPYHGPWDTF